MKSFWLDIKAGHLIIRDLLSLGVAPGIEFTAHPQSTARSRPRNQIDDDRKACQRPATPILTDERKQPVLDLVPFAGPRRKVANRNSQAAFVCQLLQLPLP